MNRLTKWLVKKAMVQTTLEGARILCIVGGLAILVSGFFFFVFSRMGLGLVATIASGQLKHIVWSTVMVVIGVLSYYFDGGVFPWSLGPILVLVAGVAGIISHLI